MQYAVEGAQKFVSAPVWKDYILTLTTNITDLARSIRNEAGSTDHQVSTASMSPVDAGWGVVDPDLRLKRAMGVRVVDASVLVSLSFFRVFVFSMVDLLPIAFRPCCTYTSSSLCVCGEGR